jgi:hypothetical protein
MLPEFSFKMCNYPHFSPLDYFQAKIVNAEDKFFQPIFPKLQLEPPHPYKIGMAVLAHERPEFLEKCLDSLFKTNLYDYDITFLIQDDGSTDPSVKRIINKEYPSDYQIHRYFSTKGHNSWGAAFNKAVRKLLEIDSFDIIGTCDSDAFFHPEWLHKTLQICLWAKQNHKDHILGSFSSFNSSDYKFHKILGCYPSPFGNYTVKRRMGALNLFYLKKDLDKLGFFEEHRDDETRMTRKFENLRVRNFCTETSYVEHMGKISILDQWRPTPVRNVVYGWNLVKNGWSDEIKSIDTLGYYKYIKGNSSTGENCKSNLKIDVLIPCIEKDSRILPYTIESVQKNLKHPLNKIFIISPKSKKIEEICDKTGSTFIDEETVLPIRKKDLYYRVNRADRSGWLFQQFLKLSGDSISTQEFFFVIDADTILIRPQVFEFNNKILFLHSDEHHQPYYDAYFYIFGKYPSTNLSFVAHQMLFQKSKLSILKNVIEQKNNNEPWFRGIYDKIDKEELSSFSEYELYGHWMMDNYPDEIEREYWFNYRLPLSRTRNLTKICNEIKDKYRSLSFHSYT